MDEVSRPRFSSSPWCFETFSCLLLSVFTKTKWKRYQSRFRIPRTCTFLSGELIIQESWVLFSNKVSLKERRRSISFPTIVSILSEYPWDNKYLERFFLLTFLVKTDNILSSHPTFIASTDRRFNSNYFIPSYPFKSRYPRSPRFGSRSSTHRLL